jgi:short-subunit dehydrogenase
MTERVLVLGATSAIASEVARRYAARGSPPSCRPGS